SPSCHCSRTKAWFDRGIQMDTSVASAQNPLGGQMATAEQAFLRTELLERRDRLQELDSAGVAPSQQDQAVGQIDAALPRLDAGSYGVCLSCHTPVERERLLQDPTVEVCLDCLSKEEQRALERDLALAARIQRGLLPRADVAPAEWHVRYHYQPAGLVSGDF